MSNASTVFGANLAIVAIEFGSAENAAAAQSQLSGISGLASVGALTQNSVVAGNQVMPTTSGFGGAVDTIPATANVGVLPDTYMSLVNTSPSILAAIGGLNTTLVASGSTSELIYQNQAADAQIFLGGGINYIKEVSEFSSATVNLDGGSVLGGGAAIIDASEIGSSTTINVFANALVNIIAGGTVAVNAGAGTVVAEVSVPPGSGAVPSVTITGAGGAGSQIDYIPNGGPAFINPMAENVVILDNGPAGSETLAGGTGAATVFGGEGRFSGGSAGGNALISGTVSGAATLIGGGAGDFLASYGVGNTMIAGSGDETLLGANGLALLGSTVVAPAGGQTFVLGAGDATVIGDLNANDTIITGTGDAVIGLNRQFALPGFNTLISSVIREGGAGGSIDIGGFLSAPFDNHDSFILAEGVTSTITSVFGAGESWNSTVVLSDGTTVVFEETTMPIVDHGGTLY
jgi:hypothetical protein